MSNNHRTTQNHIPGELGLGGRRPHRAPAPDQQLTSDGTAAADREVRTPAEPPDLDPPDSELPEPEWPDPAWPGFAPGARNASCAFTLAASPWYKERYPDKAENLWDALRAGRTPQPAPGTDRLADREAGE